MKTAPTVGNEIEHRTYGRGVVVDTRYRDVDLLVRFGYLERWVRRTDVTIRSRYPYEEEGDSRRSVARIRRDRTSFVPSGASTFAEKSILEAFRLGIVPNNAVESWTFGRDNEIQEMVAWLKNQAYGSLVLEGEYGTGKTHLLGFLYAKALEMNYAVCKIGFDPSETPAAFPKRVYRRAIQELRVPTAQGLLRFREALYAAAHSQPSAVMSDHLYFGPILKKAAKGTIRQSDWEALEGAHGQSADGIGLHDHTTSANIYCYLLSGLGHLVVEHLGALGLILLFDEVETASTVSYGYQWSRSLNFFKGLSFIANDHEELLDETVKKTGSTHCGAKTGLVYSGWQRHRYLYSIPSYLKIVFAITPGTFTNRFREWDSEQPVLTLQTMANGPRRQLFDKFVDYYGETFNVHLGWEEREPAFVRLSQRIQDGTTRQFIKAMTEMMDFRRFYPNKPLVSLFRDRISLESGVSAP